MRPYLDGAKSLEDIRYQRLQLTLSDCALTIGESKLEHIMANFYEECENSNQDCRFELDHREVNRAYIQNILSGIIHGKRGSKVSEESAIVIRGITTTQENIREIKYTVSERACRQLYERKWITDEVINSYMSLISAKRSKNSYNEAHFHFFDSLFFFKLNHL